MKKLFTSFVALSLAVVGFNALAETSATPDAAPEANPVAMEAPAPEQAPAVNPGVEVPQAISEHLALRFPGKSVQGVTREGVTYVVDLGNGLHIRYDNCYNPVCYGAHDHDCMH
ncbi:MAG: hypothetical protein K2M83_07500 [Muribaculaceae bacterium]|nr:hypothetical protein [Muribaculaceae bacterium]